MSFDIHAYTQQTNLEYKKLMTENNNFKYNIFKLRQIVFALQGISHTLAALELQLLEIDDVSKWHQNIDEDWQFNWEIIDELNQLLNFYSDSTISEMAIKIYQLLNELEVFDTHENNKKSILVNHMVQTASNLRMKVNRYMDKYGNVNEVTPILDQPDEIKELIFTAIDSYKKPII